MESPPLSPSRPFTPSKPPSPTFQKRPNHQRSSSFSSTNSLSIERRRSSQSNRRPSNSSRFSNGYDEPSSPVDHRLRTASGMNTLADELESADEDDWGEESLVVEEEEEEEEEGQQADTPARLSMIEQDVLLDPSPDGSRDSGVDVGFPKHGASSNRPSSVPNFSRPTSARSTEADFTPELEDAFNSIASLARALSAPQPDTTARTLTALRDLSSQTTLETLSHRLTTSTNSASSSLATHSKTLQSAMATLFAPLAFSSTLQETDIDDLLQSLSGLHSVLLAPDTNPLNAFVKLSRDTTDLQSCLSGLLDSLQLSKQLMTNAARAMRATSGMVAELLRERERAEESRWRIENGGWEGKLSRRWAAGECSEVLEGFERVASECRRGLEVGS